MDCFYAAALKRKTESFNQRLDKITKKQKTPKFCVCVHRVCVCVHRCTCVYMCSVNVFVHAGTHVYVLLYTGVYVSMVRIWAGKT